MLGMKNLIDPRKIYYVVFLIFINFYFSSCSPMQISQFEIQRPSKITVPREVKKVFIRIDMVEASNDKLQIKTKLLEKLAQELNDLGRFNARVINNLNENDFDPENETIPLFKERLLVGVKLTEVNSLTLLLAQEELEVDYLLQVQQLSLKRKLLLIIGEGMFAEEGL